MSFQHHANSIIGTDALKSNRLWAGSTTHDWSHRDAVFQGYIDFVNNMEFDLASQIIITMNYDGKERQLYLVLSNSDAIDAAPAFDELLAIPRVADTLTTGNISDLVPQFTGSTPHGL